MYKHYKDEVLAKVVVFSIGVFMMIKLFVPIINPASVAADLKSNQIGLFQQIINKSNASIETTMNSFEDEDRKELFPIVFKYLTNIDLSNPKSYIASQIPILGLIDITSISHDEDMPGPVVVVPTPEDDESPNQAGDNKNNSQQQNNGQEDKPSQVTPNEKNIPPMKLEPSKPLILIYHTHTTENYNPNNIDNKNFSLNFSEGVTRVGEEVKKELENKYGIATIHDMTVHDVPKREGAYGKSRPTVEKYLKKYPSLKIIIDLHRDGDLSKDRGTAIINNETYARVMFVVGTGHKNYKSNSKLSEKLNDTFEKQYPKFSRGVIYKDKAKYNQDLSPKIVLIEVGSNNNSLQEAINTAKIIAKVLAQNVK
jgi:stage II sporulation protein P